MITVLKGDPALVRDREMNLTLEWQQKHPEGEVVRRDSDEVSSTEISQILYGGGLFASEQLLVLRVMADGQALLPLLKDTPTDMILTAIDTKATSAIITGLKSVAKVIDLSKSPSVRDRRAHAENYIREHAIPLKTAALSTLLEQTDLGGTALERELDKLALLGREITPDDCRLYATLGSQANIFSIFDQAAAGQKKTALEQLEELKTTEVAYQCFAVLTGTIASLVAVAAGDAQGIHPFVANKLQSAAKRRGEQWVETCLETAMKAEHMMKRSRADEWQIVRWLVVQISS